MSRLFKFASSIVLALLAVARADEPPSAAEALSREIRAVYDSAKGSVCRIESSDDVGRLAGTGFFVDADGTLITSYSVGGQGTDLVVTIGEEKFPALRRAADERSGIAVLKIEPDAPVPFLKMGKSTALGIASPIVALGYPLELALSPSFGVIAGFDMGFRGRYFAARHLRANLTVQRGQVGSPILNMRGEAVGVLISTVEGNSGVFALPIEAAGKILHDLQYHGQIRQGWIGADVRVTDAPDLGSTARLRALHPDGPARKASLRPGDVLLQIGDWKITSPEDVLNASFYITADEPLKVRVARAGKPHDFTIIPADPPTGAESPVAESEKPLLIAPSGEPTGLGK